MGYKTHLRGHLDIVPPITPAELSRDGNRRRVEVSTSRPPTALIRALLDAETSSEWPMNAVEYEGLTVSFVAPEEAITELLKHAPDRSGIIISTPGHIG